MIPLATGWEHVDRRLQKDDVHVGLTPVKMVTSMGTAYKQPVAEPKANGYEVSLWAGPRSSTSERPLVAFADVEAAWTFAALATHYVEARSAEALAPSGGEAATRAKGPNGIVEDRSAREVIVEFVDGDSAPFEDVLD